MPDPLYAAVDEAERLLRRAEDVLKRTTTLLEYAAHQLTLTRPETPRVAALQNELQVLRATVRLFEQEALRKRARTSRPAQLLKVAG
jgi:hypothetical protein